MNYPKAIQTIRIARGLSQSALATKAGFDVSYISHLEGGRRTTSLGGLEKISKALDAPFHLLTLMAAERIDMKNGKQWVHLQGARKTLLQLLLVEDAKIKPQQILSRRFLAERLGVEINIVKNVATDTDSYYKERDMVTVREDGSVKTRKIEFTVNPLKIIQKRIYTRLLKPILKEIEEYVLGGVPRRSVVDHAIRHMGHQMVMTMDLKDCFPSISSQRVRNFWRDFGCGNDIADILTALTTRGGHLPQGIATSPALCALILRPLYGDLSHIAQKSDVSFSAYLDDLAFSGETEAVLLIKKKAERKVREYGYVLNVKKTNKTTSGHSQEICGLVVNKQPHVRDAYYEKLRKEIIDMTVAIETKLYKPIQYADWLESVKGKINHVRRFSKSKGKKLDSLLGRIELR